MKQKKTMRSWQMVIILILSVIMVITMFLPAFRVDSNVFKKQVEVITGNDEIRERYMGAMAIDNWDIFEEQLMESYDKDIRDKEQERGVHISKISPFQIMTHSFEKLIAGNDKDMEKDIEQSAYNSIFSKGHSRIRVFLWLVYVLALTIIILNLLGFILKWNKFVSLTIDTVYGVLAAALFGYMRFGFMGSIAGRVVSEKQTIFAVEDWTSDILDVLTKLMSYYYSVAFLAAFVTAILFAIFSVVSMLTGNRAVVSDNVLDDNWRLGEDIQTIAGEGIEANGIDQFYEPEKAALIPPQPADLPIEPIFEQPADVPQQPADVPQQPVAVPQQPKPAAPVPKAQPMGQIRCTKGVEAGQGFMLPQDKKVVVGKSVQNANLVINNQNISNVHCSIRYNPAANTYIIKDHSMNGTFVNGVRLQKGVAIEYPSGTVLSLADGSNEITLG